MPSIEIAGIAVLRLAVPLRTPYRLAFGPLREFDTVLVVATGDDGRTGIGEATLLPGYSDETVEQSWQQSCAIAARFPGRAAGECLALARELAPQAPFTATALATSIEMLQAHPRLQLRQPARVPLLGLVNGEASSELAEEIDALLAQGFRTLKVKVGFDASQDAKKVATIQRVVDGRALIRLDANQGYDVASACAFAASLQPQGIELFEQPCRAGDWAAAQAVARASAVPMMLDESIFDVDDIERAAQLKAARFIKLKLMKLGSLDALARALARIRELGMEPVLGNGVACEIGCWMEACVARELIANAGEMNGFLKPVTRLLANPLPFDDGAIVLPAGYWPALDPAALDRCTVESANFD
ncbi:MAG TPA: enolase C-terminal domain-like protein [Burkholderiaceae bacterium]|nr:enolase C-terminal domain-like protein [Burkholderiaceae bacterium]